MRLRLMNKMAKITHQAQLSFSLGSIHKQFCLIRSIFLLHFRKNVILPIQKASLFYHHYANISKISVPFVDKTTSVDEYIIHATTPISNNSNHNCNNQINLYTKQSDCH